MSYTRSVSARQVSARTFAALRVRNFRLYFVGQLISVSGTWMQSVAQGWLVLKLTNSSVDLGIAVALQFLPILLFGTYGGLVADRFEKRRILYFTQSAAATLAIALGLLVSTHHATLTAMYVIALGLGTVNLFDTPARQAFVQQMVGRDLIANAVSLNSVLMNAGRLVGPSIAAGFIALVGLAACFYANAFSFIAVLFALSLMRSSEFVPMRIVVRERGQLRSGLRYVNESDVLRDVLIAITAVGLFAYNFTVSLPLLAHTTFHDQSGSTYGLLMAAMGLGAVIGGLTIAYRSRPDTKMLSVLMGTFGLGLGLVALAPSALIAEILLVPTGAVSIAAIATANSLLQLNSTDYMRGRVMALYTIAFLGTTPIGAPLIGVVAGASNPRVAIMMGALVSLITGVVLLARQRYYARIERRRVALEGAV